MTRSVVFAILAGILLGAHLLAVVPQDPPLPDAVAFCDMSKEIAGSVCMCTHMEENGGGVPCGADEPRPRFCKWQCGHAKSCHCCGPERRYR